MEIKSKNLKVIDTDGGQVMHALKVSESEYLKVLLHGFPNSHTLNLN